jgi:hypothetical protein
MSALLSGLAGLIGGALGMHARRARQKQPPSSTLVCLDLAMQKVAAAEFLASSAEAYRQLRPHEALAVVRIVGRLGGDPAIVDHIRRYVAIPIARSQTAEGYFDRSLFYPPDGASAATFTPTPGALRVDYELYDLKHTVDVLRLLAAVAVPVRDVAGLVGWIQAAQAPEGRFATEARYNQLFAERHPPAQVGDDVEYHHPQITGARPYGEIEETAHAVRALRLLGAVPRDPAACQAWLQARQRADGAFAGPRHPDMWAIRNDGRDPGELSAAEQAEYHGITDLDDTYWAVLALDALAARPQRLEACRDWLRQALLVPTEYADQPQYPVEERWKLAWDRLEALYLLGGRIPNEAAWAAVGRRARKGGVLKVGASTSDITTDRLYPDDIVQTAESFRALELIGGLDAAFLASFK